MAGLAGAGIPVPGGGEALDFGCGVGRLSRALRAHFDGVLGVDIAPRMVERARELNAEIEGVEFVVNDRPDLGAFTSDRFAFVLSFIALQHVSSDAAVRGYVRDFVRVAQPGGLVVFQLPAAVRARVRLHPLRVAQRGLRALGPARPRRVLRRLMRRSMTLRALPEAEVRALVREAGGEVLVAFDDQRTGSAAVESRLYVVRKPAPAG